MNKAIFSKYAHIKNQIKELTEEAREMEMEVVEAMDEYDTIETEDGSFYLRATKKWKYTKAIDVLNEDLKKRRRDEESSGKATCVETKSLAFRGKTEE